MTLIDRFLPDLRRERQAAIDARQLYKLDEIALLEPAQLRPPALLSLLMLVAGGTFFGLLNIIAYFSRVSWYTFVKASGMQHGCFIKVLLGAAFCNL